ncbi:zinc-binding, partial [Haematococcus lacustris]
FLTLVPARPGNFYKELPIIGNDCVAARLTDRPPCKIADANTPSRKQPGSKLRLASRWVAGTHRSQRQSGYGIWRRQPKQELAVSTCPADVQQWANWPAHATQHVTEKVLRDHWENKHPKTEFVTAFPHMKT